jgi:hypothetical protein
MIDLISLFSSSPPVINSREVSYPLEIREILAFRLSQSFEVCVNTLDLLVRTKDVTNLNEMLLILSTLCVDFDFSFQLGSFGGHVMLKKAMNIDEVLDNADSVVMTIIQSGCVFPMPKDIAFKENIVRPLRYRFPKGSSHAITDGSDSHVDLVLRQIPTSMHGEGQSAVGYIIWSAAVIMGR